MENIQQHIDNLLNSKIGKITNNRVLTNISRTGTFKDSTTNGLESARQVNKQPVQLIKDDVVIYEFDSSIEASEFLSVHPQSIQKALNGKWKTCKGYIVKKK
jgi:hypothetical protein